MYFRANDSRRGRTGAAANCRWRSITSAWIATKVSGAVNMRFWGSTLARNACPRHSKSHADILL